MTSQGCVKLCKSEDLSLKDLLLTCEIFSLLIFPYFLYLILINLQLLIQRAGNLASLHSLPCNTLSNKRVMIILKYSFTWITCMYIFHFLLLVYITFYYKNILTIDYHIL